MRGMKRYKAVKYWAILASMAMLMLCACPPRTQRVSSAEPQPMDRTASTEPASDQAKNGASDAGDRPSPDGANSTTASAGANNSQPRGELAKATAKPSEPQPALPSASGEDAQGEARSTPSEEKTAQTQPEAASAAKVASSDESRKLDDRNASGANHAGGTGQAAPVDQIGAESSASLHQPPNAASGRPTPTTTGSTSTPNPDAAKQAVATRSPLLYSPQTNPTTAAGRGQPSLLDPMRPCVFMSLDGREGALPSGKMQWVLDGPVNSTPRLVIRTVPEVLGDVVRVRLMLIRLVEDSKAHGFRADSKWLYMIESKSDGAVEAAAEIWLCASPVLAYTDKGAGVGASPSAVIERLPPLPAGVYELVGEIVGSMSEERTLAVTQFTVTAP